MFAPRRRVSLTAFFLLLAMPAAGGVVFTEVTEQAGTVLDHDPDGALSQGTPTPNLWGPGVAWVDCNGDGWLDLFVSNGAAGDRIYLNDADGTFTETSAALGLRGTRSGNGVAAADFDNDGDEDIAVANFLGQPYVYGNFGSSFGDMASTLDVSPMFTAGTGATLVPRSMGVTFGDINQDGYLDLYIANYTQQPDVLYRNLGNLFLRTDDVSATANGFGFMAVFLDYDDDGDQDIYVANDFGFNYLLENQGAGSDYALVDVASARKVDGGSNPLTDDYVMGMGLAVADYDNDLDLDIYVTNYFRNALYENRLNETGRFRQVAEEAGVQFDQNCWGIDFCDLDLDGDLDLIQASGYIYSQMQGFIQPLDLPNRVWLNNLVETGQKTFTNVSGAAGFDDRGMGRALATGDFDRDGDLDVVITNNSFFNPDSLKLYTGHLMLYRNDQDLSNNWVNLRLRGGGPHSGGLGCNLDGVGARVYVHTASSTQMREVQAGSSYLSQNSLEVEFGLGSEEAITEVEVRWPCGTTESFTGVTPGRFWVLEEGAGNAHSVPVAFASFAASAERDGVRLEWFTAAERAVRTIVYRAPADRADLFHPIAIDVDYHDGRGLAFDDGVVAGEHYAYRVTIEGSDGNVVTSPVALVKAGGSAPGLTRARVGQNYPNPFNPNTIIEFELPRGTTYDLRIYDPRGRLVRTLGSGELEAGTHQMEWNGQDDQGRAVASGNYHYVLVTPDGTSSRMMTLVQ